MSLEEPAHVPPGQRRARILITVLLLVIALVPPIAVARELIVANAGTSSPVDDFTDANTYRAAGERLNAGHDLFSIGEGDREILLVDEFPAALLSPPPIAVLWRPIAAIPVGFEAWIVATWVALLGTIAYLVLKTGLPAALVSLALFIPIGEQLAIGNVSAFFPAVLVVTWRYRHTPWVGVGVGVISAIKFSPIAMTGWMAGGRWWRMLAVTIGTIGVVGILGGLGAGFGSYLDYLRVAPQIKATQDSISAVTGVSWASYGVLVVGIVAAAVLGGRWPRWSYAVAVVAVVFGTPVLYPIGLVPLLALAAPLVPDAGRATEPAAGPSRLATPEPQPG